MSKKNKVIYSDIQPNAKEAGVWVNTTDGNVKVEKDGKWVDDGGSGANGGNNNALYYLLDEPVYLQGDSSFTNEFNVFSTVRGSLGESNATYYGTVASLNGIFGAKYSSFGTIDAVEFKPIQYITSDRDMNITTFTDYESLLENHTYFPKVTRITAEEYWQYYKEV